MINEKIEHRLPFDSQLRRHRLHGFASSHSRREGRVIDFPDLLWIGSLVLSLLHPWTDNHNILSPWPTCLPTVCQLTESRRHRSLVHLADFGQESRRSRRPQAFGEIGEFGPEAVWRQQHHQGPWHLCELSHTTSASSCPSRKKADQRRRQRGLTRGGESGGER